MFTAPDPSCLPACSSSPSSLSPPPCSSEELWARPGPSRGWLISQHFPALQANVHPRACFLLNVVQRLLSALTQKSLFMRTSLPTADAFPCCFWKSSKCPRGAIREAPVWCTLTQRLDRGAWGGHQTFLYPAVSEPEISGDIGKKPESTAVLWLDPMVYFGKGPHPKSPKDHPGPPATSSTGFVALS